MIIWQGLGILVPAIFVATTVPVFIIAIALFGDESANHPWTMGLALLLSAVCCWFVGKRLHNPDRGKVVLDPSSGREIVLLPSHSLFFVKMEYWGVLFAILGVVMFVNPLVG